MTAAIGTLFGGGEMLAIDRIRRDPRTQPRNHINHEVVERYRDAMEAGDTFPPVTVFFDGADYWLADGWHRVCAALCLGWQAIAVEIREGGLRDAEWHSFSVNATHGYPRGKDDTGRILGRIFRDLEWSAKGLMEISRHCVIPKSTVSDHYRKIIATLRPGELGIKPSIREVEKADGTTYEMETRNIGRQIEEPPRADWRDRIEADDEDEEPRQSCGNCKNALYVSGSGSLVCLVFEKQTFHDAIIGETCPCWKPDPENEEFQLGEVPEPPPPPDPKFAFQAFPPEHAKPAGMIRYLLNSLRQELTLSPEDLIAASPWTDAAELREQATVVSDWLTRLAWKLLDEEE